VCEAYTSRRLLELLCSGLGSGPKLPAREMLPMRRRGVADPWDPPPGLPRAAARRRARAASPDAAPAAAANAAVRGLMAAADMAAAEPGVGGAGDAGCDARACISG